MKETKYIVLLGDGMADYPIPALNNKTPLQFARKPNIDRLAANAELGLVRTIPPGMAPGSDVANLSVMGYDPRRFYTGRSPLEAISMGVDLQPQDVAFRCNLVTLSDAPVYQDKTMVDYSSDEITTPESKELIQYLSDRLGNSEFRFFAGVSYRHLMVWKNGREDAILTPPHDISDRIIADYLPRGEGSSTLLNLMTESNRILPEHPVNRERSSRGLRPANSLWFWGQGRKPALPSFMEKYGLNGSVISAVDLTKGIGLCAGLRPVAVPGATGNIHTNFEGKAKAALEELRAGQDFIYIHVEAPDEAGHRGEMDTKIKAIEAIDRRMLEILLEGLETLRPYKLLIMPDHPTPLSTRTHSADSVPFMIYHSEKAAGAGASEYSEETAARSGLLAEEGHLLMDRFLKEGR